MTKNILYSFLSLILLLQLPSVSSAQIRKDTTEAGKLYATADSLFQSGSYDASLSLYTKVSETYKKYSLWKKYAFAQASATEALTRQGKFDEALKTVSDALILNGSKNFSGTDAEASLLNQLGNIYLNKGRNDLALENFRKALNLYTALPKADRNDLASCYTNIGIAYWNAANNELALEHLQKALTLRTTLYGAEHPEAADAYNNLGLVYASSDPVKALDYYKRALIIYEKAYGQNHPNVAIAYNNIAFIDRRQGRYDEALANFQKVLFIRQALKQDRHPTVAFVYSNIGQIYADRKETDNADIFLNKALDIYKENYGEKHPEIAGIYNQMANLRASDNKYKAALEYYQKAFIANIAGFNSADVRINPRVTEYYNANILLYSLLMKARTLEAMYVGKTLRVRDIQLALSTFHSCDTLIERIRKVQTNKNDKIELGKTAAGIYEDAIRVCMTLRDVTASKRKYEKDAFYFGEKSKTAVLLEAISDTEAKHFANIPDSLLEKEKFIKSEISFYEQKLAEKTDATSEQQYRDILFGLNRRYENFIADLEKGFPQYYNLKYDVQTVTVSSIQKVLDDQTALISYFIADSSHRVYIFCVTKKKFKVYDVPKDKDLHKLLLGYRNSIKYDSKDVYLETANKLYRQLFPFKLKSSVTQLIIVPDGRLGTIPFEAFVTKKQNPEKSDYSDMPYLLKKHAITYSYSANLYEQATRKTPANATSSKVFLCAPVSFSGHTGNLNDLPASGDEIAEIGSICSKKGVTCKSYVGSKVQESLIKSGELEAYTYLHFATHGIVDENKPELSEIYLAPDTTTKEDGNLYSGEIYNLKINADLVMLSACQTGLGKVTKGEGIIGLTRALLYAGGRNLVVSLWSVADKSTSMLMVDFYNVMFDSDISKGYSKSLQASKLKMISQEPFNRPYFWAPFVLIGK